MGRWKKATMRRSSAADDALICSVAAICEAAILVFASRGTPIVAIVVVHGAVVAGLLVRLLVRIRSVSDTSMLVLAVVATASTGPIGALGCAILAWLRIFTIAPRFAFSIWHPDSARQISEAPAAAMAGQIQSGRAMDPFTPVPECLETILTVGPPSDRTAALCRLSTKYDPAFARPLQAALASASLPIRTPAYAIFASLLETALAQAASLAHRPVETAENAHYSVAEASALLSRLPFDVAASPITERVAADVHALCRRVLGMHPDHRSALIVGSRALVILERYQEAEHLLRDLGDDSGEDTIALRLECLARLGRYSEFGRLLAQGASS